MEKGRLDERERVNEISIVFQSQCGRKTIYL